MNEVITDKLPEEDAEAALKVYFVWPRESRGYYNRAHPMAVFDGSILSGYGSNDIEKMYGKKGATMIGEYLEKKGIELGDNVVDISAVRERCDFLGALVKTPALFTIETLNIYGMGEMLVLIILPILGALIGAFIDSKYKPEK